MAASAPELVKTLYEYVQTHADQLLKSEFPRCADAEYCTACGRGALRPRMQRADARAALCLGVALAFCVQAGASSSP
jgi:hypothetical protein